MSPQCRRESTGCANFKRRDTTAANKMVIWRGKTEEKCADLGKKHGLMIGMLDIHQDPASLGS
jgi:hypothetical protein